MTRRAWACIRLAGAGAVIAAVVARFGTGPFLAGLRSVSGGSLVAACGIGLVTTAACARRWCSVTDGLGVPLPFGRALAAYYRSQFLNGALPGGILGDLHRGVRHGRDVGDLGRGLRAVVWERVAGQAVQVAVTLLVLGAVPSPVPRAMPAALIVAAICTAVAVRTAHCGASRAASRARSSLLARPAAELRAAVTAAERWPGIVGTSVLAVCGHAATFVIAARVTGVTAPLAQLLPLALLVLLAAAVPLNVGGWGPREGAAGWAFAAAGLGAAHGVAAGTAYGVLAAAASLPGAAVLAAGRFARRTRAAAPAPGPGMRRDVLALASGDGRG